MLSRSVCPYDCPDACGLLITVENGQAIAVAGDPAHPVTRGFICGKMQLYQQTVHSPQAPEDTAAADRPQGERAVFTHLLG